MLQLLIPLLWLLTELAITARQAVKSINQSVKRDVYGIGFCHPLDGVTNPMYKLFCFLTTIFFIKRRRH